MRQAQFSRGVKFVSEADRLMQHTHTHRQMRLKSLVALPFLAASLALPAAAQDNSPGVDPEYVRDFPQTLTVRTYVGEKISIFGIEDRKNDVDIRYRPNNILAVGVGVTVKGIGLNFSTRIPGYKDKEDQYGRTRRIDIQVHRYRGKLAVDAYFQRYRGFHINDLEDVTRTGTPPKETVYPYFPNMQTITAGATVMYVFNGNRVSLRAPVNQQEWQLRSAGSPLLGAGLYYRDFSNKDSTFIPQYIAQRQFLDGSQISRVQNYSLTVNGGYGYHFVFKRHLYLMVGLEAGAGLGYSVTHDTLDKRQSKLGPQFTGNVRAGFGYNSRHWQSGIYSIVHSDRMVLPYDQTNLSTSLGIVRFFVAYRFDEPGFLRKIKTPGS